MTMGKNSQKISGNGWTVEHDSTKCALCVVCAKNCPTEALQRDQEGGDLCLYFNASLCTGCEGIENCGTRCPEKAIKPVEAGSTSAQPGYVLLMQSKMAQCQECEEYFAPLRRLDVIDSKRSPENKVERLLCPLCKRAHLVEYYIEEHRVPGSKAEFRSARYMINKAKKRLAAEEGK